MWVERWKASGYVPDHGQRHEHQRPGCVCQRLGCPRAWHHARLLSLDRHRLNRDRLERTVSWLARGRAADLVHDVHALDDLAEHAVLVVEPWRRHQRDEELSAVGVRTA